MRRLFLFLFLVAGMAVAASAQTTTYGVEKMSGWQACSSCAGVNGQIDAHSSFAQNQSTPSMDGRSTKYTSYRK